jgi:hypothetical protein
MEDSLVDRLLHAAITPNSTNEELEMILEDFCTVFDSHDDLESLQACMARVFRVPESDAAQLHNRRLELQEKFSRLYTTMKARNRDSLMQAAAENGEELHEDIAEDLELTFRFTQISERMRYLYDLACLSKVMLTPSEARPLRESNYRLFFQDVETNDCTNAAQSLLWFYWHWAHDRNLMKIGKNVYEPVIVDDVYVYAYRPLFTIDEMVYEAVHPIEQYKQQFLWLTNASNTADWVIKQLTHFKSEYFPELARDPYFHSFQNGVYHTIQRKFYWFDPPNGDCLSVDSLQRHVIATKYHDTFFDDLKMKEERKSALHDQKDHDYMFIRNEPLNNILDGQEFSDEEKWWIAGMLGRLLYSLHDVDGWETCLMLIGVAGTGKSTLLRVMAEMFEMQDVAYLNNRCQTQFALDGTEKGRVLFMNDIDENFGLDQITFQGMVSGEVISIIRKGKQPIEMKWDKPMAAAMNEMIKKWIDKQNSLARRMFPVHFRKVVKNPDPNLMAKFRDNVDRTMVMINEAYLDLANNYQNVALTEVMPRAFKDFINQLSNELNSLRMFITDKCELALEAGVDLARADQATLRKYSMTASEFKSKYHEFCRTIVNKAQAIDSSAESIFNQYNVTIKSADKNDPVHRSQKYYLGIRYRDNGFQSLYSGR